MSSSGEVSCDEKPEGCCTQSCDAKAEAETKSDSASTDAVDAVAAPVPAGGDSSSTEEGALDASS